MKYLAIFLLLCSSCTISRKTSTSIVLLYGSKTFDPDGWIVKYNWELVLNNSGTTVQILNKDSAVAKAIITAKGVYVFKIHGTDNDGATSYKMVTKVVQ